MIDKYNQLAQKSLTEGTISADDIRWIMEDESLELLPLLQAAFTVRQKYFGKGVKIHIINNVQSGNCSEDCRYCGQSRNMKDKKENIYPMKNDNEILAEAKAAYEGGAYRYCMVFSGRDLGKNRIDRICEVVGKIKQKYSIEVCVSAGTLNQDEAATLKAAGVDRYNHNVNTSSNKYGEICTSHSYEHRVGTIHNARNAGLDICSGVIIGMGESINDLVQITEELKKVEARSVPINFFIPIEGHGIKNPQPLNPEYCLKVLALFRLALPDVEVRAAGGREYHLRSLQALALYPCNSLFSRGYLTTGGETIEETKKMIVDAGFYVDSIED